MTHTKQKTEKNAELDLAWEFVEETGCHVFLTGRAGTGKTTFLKNLKKSTAKRMIITAPTGVAAINADGVTLHSFFQLPFGPFIPGSEGSAQHRERLFRFSREKKQIIKSLDLLVIDEVSMVRADVLDAVDMVLRRLRGNNRVFGGVQLLVIGDLYQLPPVVKPNEWNLLKQVYESIYFFSSHAVKAIDLAGIELKKVYRQEDENFVHLLNKVRDNRLDPPTLESLNSRVQKDFTPDDNQGWITLTTHNRNADIINREKLDAIPGDTHRLNAQISGEFPEQVYPTFLSLSLKQGAQVMFLRNDASVDKRYYNGKIGRIESISGQTVRVVCPDDPDQISVEPVEWQNIKYSVNQQNQEIEEEIIGRFKQFPLKPAWAITIHKSQGLTFDKAVIDAQAAFAQGQVYVALSRCKTIEGLVLASPVPSQGIKPDEAISGFISHFVDNTDLTGRIQEEKIAYQQQLLIQCFDFQALSSRLGYFFSLLSRHRDRVRVSGVSDMGQIRESAQKDIFQVSESFKRQLTGHFTSSRFPAEDAYIRERVKKASEWFKDKLALVFDDMVNNLVTDTDNKAIARQLKTVFDTLSCDIGIKRAGIESCENGFSPAGYLQAVSKAQIRFTPGKASKNRAAKKQAPVYSESDISHPGLFQQLKEWRLDLAKQKNVAAFQILHQRVLIQIVVQLPRNEQELEGIHGMGPKTIANYGRDILEIVLAYRKAHDIKTVILPEIKKEADPPKKAAKKQKPVDTKKLSFDLFKQGMSLPDIARKRELVENTVLGHLAHYIESGSLGIDQLLTPEKQSRIEKEMAKQTAPSLKALKTLLGDDVSYGDIKLMTAHVKYRDLKSEK